MCEAILHYRGRPVTGADLALIRQLLAAHPQASRRQLSALLCQAWNWVQPNGQLPIRPITIMSPMPTCRISFSCG